MSRCRPNWRTNEEAAQCAIFDSSRENFFDQEEEEEEEEENKEKRCLRLFNILSN